MPFANIRISQGSKVLYGWYICPIPSEMMVKEISVPNIQTSLDFEKINYIEISQSINSEAIRVSPDCKIIEITNTFGTNIHYHLKNEEKLHANTLNSFDIL